MDETLERGIIPQNDAERLEALKRYKILDSPPEESFNNIARLMADTFKVPIALISLVGRDRVFFKGNVGMPGVQYTDRSESLCSFAILSSEPTVFDKPMEEPCLLTNPLVHGEFGLRFYAGAPLVTSDGYHIGAVCVVDKRERTFSAAQQETLLRFARLVMHEIELRHTALLQAQTEGALRKSEEQQKFLLQLSDHLRPLGNPAEIQYAAACALGAYLGANRAGYAEDGGDGETIVVTRNFTSGVPGIEGRYLYDDYGPELLQAFRAGRTVVRNDIAQDITLTEAEKQAHAALHIGASINVPMLKEGRLFGVLFLHCATAHPWTEEEVALVRETAERTWEAVERARAEVALRRSEERLQKVVSIETVGVIYFDLEGVIHDANAAFERMSGYSREAFQSGAVRWDQLTPPEFMEATLRSREELLKRGQNTPYEKQYIRPDGSRWWGLFAGKRLSEGECVEFVLDISATKELEATLEGKVRERTADLEKLNRELKRSNAQLEDFAYAASHDLKEPVRKVHFFSDRLKSELEGQLTESQQRLFERIEYANHRMGQLIEDLLTYSQVSRGISNLEVVDLNEKVQLVLEDLELTIQEKGAKITVDPLPIIRGHKRQLQQLFQNLLGNALKYSKKDEPPQIHIHVRTLKGNQAPFFLGEEEKEKSFHLLEVRDNGIGFEQKEAERIFGMFQRLHGKAEYEGTGIGLAIVQKVVENHCGYIWATSEPGEGATFGVLLPAG